jgi:hypothetical protein
MRLAAWRALESAVWNAEEREERMERALGDDSALIRDHARRRRSFILNGQDNAVRNASS